MAVEKQAIEILTECVAGRTLQLARIVAAQYDRALASVGVTPQQMTLLCVVCKRQPVSPREVLPYLKMDQSTLSRNLDRMVEKGWLSTNVEADDGRIKLYSLTKAGERTIAAAHSHWLDAQAWANDALGTDGITDIKRIANNLNPLLPL